MSDPAAPEAAEPPPVVAPGGRSMLRAAGAAAVILAAVLAGVAIGANVWPRITKVEQRVVEPVRIATSARPGLDAIPDLVERSCPAIVLLRSAGAADKAPASAGSAKGPAAPPPVRAVGFVISEDGYLLTSAAAVPDGDVEAVLGDGRVVPAARKAADDLSGLALFKVEAGTLPALRFADDGFPRIGQTGLALTSPNGTGCIVTAVLVSTDFLAGEPGLRTGLEVRPALDPTLAGMPVLDLAGRVIAIAGLAPQDDADADSTVLLPASTADRVADELVRNGTSPENAFGFEVEDVGPTLAARAGASRARGAIVSLIEQNSPADKGGLRAGDVIVAAAGQPVSSASELARALDTGRSALTLQVQRRSQGLTLDLQDGE
ncbi:S1C family serine protease [Sphingomonas sp. DT-204]|uniref:S1C family serine protease n=1 Tax=Sphingomonas sp. DT-204 TaxID=3396166 RepID=UPI003F1D56C8